MTHVTRCVCCGKPSPYELCSRECAEAYRQSVRGRDGMKNRGGWHNKVKLKEKEAMA